MATGEHAYSFCLESLAPLVLITLCFTFPGPQYFDNVRDAVSTLRDEVHFLWLSPDAVASGGLKCKLNLITTTFSLHDWYTESDIGNMLHILCAVTSNSVACTHIFHLFSYTYLLTYVRS
jgi:hypothetical protein